MEKEIYIVVSGEYSDYEIDAVFSTRKLALDYIQQNGSDYRIETYNLDEEVVKETKLWRVLFRLENNILESAIPVRFKDNHKNNGTCEVSEGRFDRLKYITFYVDSDSMDKAAKIASERFAAVKANAYIWIRLTRPYAFDEYGMRKYETFNVKTNEFAK